METISQYNYQKEILLKFDYTAGKVYYWRFQSLEPYTKNSAEHGHLDSIITGVSSDANNLPVKGFIATSLYQFRYYNEYCDAGIQFKINKFRSVFDLFDWSGTNQVRFGTFDRIEIHEKSCRKESTGLLKDINIRQTPSGRAYNTVLYKYS